MDLGKAFKRYGSVVESFVHKTRSKKNTDLISKPSFVLEDGVYILHETLGVRGVEGWNPKFNKGVVGVLLIEDDHKIVVALEDSSNELCWSEENKLVNQPVENSKTAKSDFNGEEHCRKLNSPDFPAAYYCLNYNKGGRDWYLPSMGELWLIYRHLEEIQTALSIVGGQKFVTTWDDDVPFYWSSTEYSATRACPLNLSDGYLGIMGFKVSDSPKVRPVSKFNFSTLKESFTRKIRSKKNNELTIKADTAFVPDGVYILHETLGVRTVDSWNPKNNNGVVGILLVEDDHKIVVATEDAPNKLYWSKKCKLNNEPICAQDEAASDFNGEYYCQNLKDSVCFTDCFAVYYCKTYNKGNRNWYLPSSGELWMIYNHLEEIQNALETVGGQKFATEWNDGVYWSSTERNYLSAWSLHLSNGNLNCIGKYLKEFHVRPVSKFGPSKTLKESFTRKIRSKKNDELTTKADTAFVPDGVYILHETLGVKTVDGWNPKDNEGVTGILLIEDDHKIVVATEDAPENLTWSEKRGLINQPVYELEDAQNDFNGEYYCRKLDSPDYPAAYYCLNYKKGNRSWYLPSSGELWLIYNHLEEIQNTLETVGGQKLITAWDEGVPVYWSSTENRDTSAWYLGITKGKLDGWHTKVSGSGKVRPVSKFDFSTLKESFTRKIRSKKNDELTTKADTAFIPDGVYILHETLGVITVDGWNPKNNKGVVGILFIEDDHKIVVALEDSPENLTWSNEYELINQPVDVLKDIESDFNGEYYCQKLDSPDFPAAYYCKTYNKGGRSWHLPSSGELWLIYRHLDEIQNALETVGGQKLVTNWDEDITLYWSSTERSPAYAWHLCLFDGFFNGWYSKVNNILKVRPVSAFSV